jgi:hypothetical protein
MKYCRVTRWWAAGLAAVVLPLVVAAEPLTIPSGIPVNNPPKTYTKKEPKAEDFNLLLRAFFETEKIDVGKEDIDPVLTDLFNKDTSNATFARLKLREKKFAGAILVGPVAIGNLQIVAVSARIVYRHWHTDTLYSESIEIVFTKNGKFKEVRRGSATQQDL